MQQKGLHGYAKLKRYYSGIPWFCKTLPVPTTKICNCHNTGLPEKDTALELIELYIR